MTGYVYAIECGEAVKLGYANDPWRCLSELNVGHPGKHRLLGYAEGTRAHESELHFLCRHERIKGEWFRKAGVVFHFLNLLPKREQLKPPTKPRSPQLSFRSIIERWPSGEAFGSDLELKHASHGRLMKIRNSIPERHWKLALEAAQHRGIELTEDDLRAALDARREQ